MTRVEADWITYLHYLLVPIQRNGNVGGPGVSNQCHHRPTGTVPTLSRVLSCKTLALQVRQTAWAEETFLLYLTSSHLKSYQHDTP